MKVAPYDFLQADEQLSKEEMHAVQKDSHLWVADGLYPLLPWSCCVLDSVPWDTAPSHAPYSSVLPISRYAKVLRSCSCWVPLFAQTSLSACKFAFNLQSTVKEASEGVPVKQQRAPLCSAQAGG